MEDPNVPVKKRKIRYGRLIIVILALLMLVALAYFGWIYIRMLIMSDGNVAQVPHTQPPVDIEEPVFDPNEGMTPDPNVTEEPIDPNDIPPIYYEDQIDPNVLNVLILGNDAYDGDTDMGRTDVMMLLSYNYETREVKMLSFLRDSYVHMPGRNKWNRLNTAFRFGSESLTINTINSNFNTDVQYYARVNFDMFMSIINRLGGIEMDLTLQEIRFINKKCPDEPALPLVEGEHTLTGRQALFHVRNRSSANGDWDRTQRQRNMMVALFEKIKNTSDIFTITGLINDLSTHVRTNLSPGQMISLGTNLLFGDKIQIEGRSVPFEGTWEYMYVNGSAVISLDAEENARLIYQYLYED